MDDHVAVIHDDPLAQRKAIHRARTNVVILLQLVLNLARDCLEMRLGRAGADDEEIGEVRNLAKVEGNDALRVFVRGQFRAQDG